MVKNKKGLDMKKIKLLFLVVTLSVSQQCFAFFNAHEAPLPPKTPLVIDKSPSFFIMGNENGISQKGYGKAGNVNSMGENMELNHALKLILPPKWKWAVHREIYDDGSGNPKKDKSNFFMKKRVSWKNKGTWLNVLEKISEEENLRFLISWPDHKLYIAKANPVFPFDISEAKEAAAEISNEKKLPTWMITKGSFRSQLSKWCKQEGYQLLWKLPYDYEFSVKAKYRGSFEETVKTVVESIFTSGIKIYAKIYHGNKVLLIEGE